MNPAIFAIPAVVMFLFAVWQANGMLAHRDKKVSWFWFMTHGIAFYTGQNFLPEAAPFRRRFVMAAAGFFLCVLGGSITGILLAQP